MAIKGGGFQEAVNLLGGLEKFELPNKQRPAPSPKESASLSSSENPPFKGAYEKFTVLSSWLQERGLSEDTLKRFEVFQYKNPKRRSVYSGSVMLKIRRYSDGEDVR